VLSRPAMEIDRPVASYHCDPRSERCGVTKGLKFPESVEKDVLHKIVHLSPGHSREQDAVYQRCIEIVEA